VWARGLHAPRPGCWGVGFGPFVYRGAVETVVRVRSALCGLGLADRLGPLDRDRGELGRLLVELIVEDTVQVHRALGSLLPCPCRAHNVYATDRRSPTLPIA